ncbi:3'-5' exonuclease [Candidatus Giovannonibacteria bacterium]|nr:3'-5' exonuclease [Candidatus Giovannonibacteria bacterium]
MKGKDFDTKIAPISFIDLEMTGLESSKHEIIEIGLVKTSQPGLEVIETWEIKVKPLHLGTADPEALKISGYDENAWKNAISLKEMMNLLAPKIKGSILAGFNVSCDYAFLDVATTQTGIPLDFHRRILDVNAFICGKLGCIFGEKGLSSFSKEFNINLDKHHTALADAMAAYELYKKIK